MRCASDRARRLLAKQCLVGSVGGRHRPAEAGQLPRHGDGAESAPLAALGIQSHPAAVQALLGLSGDRADRLRLALLAPAQLGAFARRSRVAPITSTFMGHFSIKVTFDLYGHLMPGTEAEAAALLDAFLDGEAD